jgi:hypothetical protein
VAATPARTALAPAPRPGRKATAAEVELLDDHQDAVVAQPVSMVVR